MDNVVAIDGIVKLLERRKLLFFVAVLSVPQPFARSLRDGVRQRSEFRSDIWIPSDLVFSIGIGTIAIFAFYSWFSKIKPDLVYEVAVRYFFVLLYFLVVIAFSFPFLPYQTVACGIPILFWLSIHLYFIWRSRDSSHSGTLEYSDEMRMSNRELRGGKRAELGE
ncbi:hypothetical protein VN12_14285 [Pirellula sp. SH-Sr6A]|uniref:hypothetical protein n=1 Tax=Pirellula sp. SH-Sr6A TaxID=1632865 RepID=UPI00078B4C7C|nr:hypothetical protein [Pirellula sp. SH-Sr6A]AMV33292.1 hypothetical protein VN12_14285 [Pirellula sp. SH-Sr6A]